MLKLKLQYFGHLMQRADSLEKTLMLGKTEGRRLRLLAFSPSSLCKGLPCLRSCWPESSRGDPGFAGNRQITILVPPDC